METGREGKPSCLRCGAPLSSESSRASGMCGNCHRVDPRYAAAAKVTDSEGLVRAKYEAKGWRVIHNGAPDFLMVREGSGAIKVLAVEVKRGRAALSPAQREWKELLEALGVEYRVERTGRVLYRLGAFGGNRNPNDRQAPVRDFSRALSDEVRRRLRAVGPIVR